MCRDCGVYGGIMGVCGGRIIGMCGGLRVQHRGNAVCM